MNKHELLAKIQGIEIVPGAAVYDEIHELKADNEQLVMEMNEKYHAPEEVRRYLERITGKEIADSVAISLPFYTDYGRHISFGKDIFINQNVMFVDLGGIVIEDHVLIGPMCRIITVSHLVEPKKEEGFPFLQSKLKKMLG